MKRILILLLAAAVAAAAFTGCQSPKTDAQQNSDPTRVPLSELNITFRPTLPDAVINTELIGQQTVDLLNRPVFTEDVRVPNVGEEGSYYRVVTDYAQLKDLIGSASDRLETAINEDTFIANFVVAVFVTVRTGGYGFNVDFAENDSHTVKVEIGVTPPGEGVNVTQAFETHCILVGFDAADYYDDLVYDISVNGAEIGTQAQSGKI